MWRTAILLIAAVWLLALGVDYVTTGEAITGTVTEKYEDRGTESTTYWVFLDNKRYNSRSRVYHKVEIGSKYLFTQTPIFKTLRNATLIKAKPKETDGKVIINQPVFKDSSQLNINIK